MHGERCIVRLDNCVGHFWRWHHREGRHHTVGVLFTDLGDEQRTHTSAGTTAERVGDLESLQHVTVFGLFANDVHDRVHELGALGVVALGPVVAGTALAKDKVVRAEQMAQRARADRVHCARLEIDQHGAWHVLVVRRLVVVHVNALQLKGRCAYIVAGAVDAMFIRQHLPELGSDLVTTLAGLQVYDLTHVVLDETKRSVASRATRLGFFRTRMPPPVPTLCAFRASPTNTHLHHVDRRALIATHAFVTWITARPYELGRTQGSIGRCSLVCSARHRTRPHLGTWHYVWIGCTHSARCLYGCL